MPRKACNVCGGPSLPRSTRCALHPLASSPNRQRDYRGLAAYRHTAARVLERDAGVCHLCGQPGADTIDHHPVPYSRLPVDPETGRVPLELALDESNLRAAHGGCNRRKGARRHTPST